MAVMHRNIEPVKPSNDMVVMYSYVVSADLCDFWQCKRFYKSLLSDIYTRNL